MDTPEATEERTGQANGDQAGANQPSTDGERRCRNCGARLVGPFCAECGQEARRRAVPVWQFGREALGEVFSFDARFLRTLKPLLFKPGFLTNEYFAGRRKRYVPPLRMYVFVSFVCFLIFAVLSGKSAQRGFQKGFEGASENDSVTVDTPGQRAAPKTDAPAPRSADSSLRGSGEKRLTAAPSSFGEKVTAAQEDVGAIFAQRLSVIFFLAVPLLALVLKLLHWRSGRFYVHHLIFAFHVQAFGFFMFMLGTLAAEGMDLFVPDSFVEMMAKLIALTMLGFTLVYALVAVRRVYRQAWWKTVLKTVLTAVCYAAIFMLAFFAVLIGSAVLFY